jgi:hypothetical protein
MLKGNQSDFIRRVLCTYVDEMYPMERGVFIADPQKTLLIGDCRISRRQIKYVVEQRKAEHKSLKEVIEIINLIPETISTSDFEGPNYSPKYPRSIIRAKVFSEWEQGMVVVLDQERAGARDLITAHLYSPDNMDALRKKLDTSAAGKTPHS